MAGTIIVPNLTITTNQGSPAVVNNTPVSEEGVGPAIDAWPPNASTTETVEGGGGGGGGGGILAPAGGSVGVSGPLLANVIGPVGANGTVLTVVAGAPQFVAPVSPPVTLAGDVTGPSGANTVVKWEGVPLDAVTMAAPTATEVPQYSGTEWEATNAASLVSTSFGAMTGPEVAAVAAVLPAPGPPSGAQVSQALSQTRLQYWSGVPYEVSGITWGANCALIIGDSNIGVYQSATNLLQSCSRGTANTSTGGPAWIGSYDASASTGSYKTSFVLRGAAPGIGGFTHSTRFGIEQISATPTLYCFVGLMDASGGGGALPQQNIDFTTQTTLQVVGIAFTQTVVGGVLTGNWQVVSCNGAAVTVTNSGVPLVVGNLVELILTALPNAATIGWTINDLTAATSTSGTISLTLPANTLALAWQAGMEIHSGGGATNTFSTVRYTMDSNY